MEKYLFKITFNNEGNLVNPNIESPYYIESDLPVNAMIDFLNDCRTKYYDRQLSPNNIIIVKLIPINKIRKQDGEI